MGERGGLERAKKGRTRYGQGEKSRTHGREGGGRILSKGGKFE